MQMPLHNNKSPKGMRQYYQWKEATSLDDLFDLLRCSKFQNLECLSREKYFGLTIEILESLLLTDLNIYFDEGFTKEYCLTIEILKSLFAYFELTGEFIPRRVLSRSITNLKI